MNSIDRIFAEAYSQGYSERARKIAAAGGRVSAIVQAVRSHIADNPGAYIGGAAGAAGGAAIGAATGEKGRRGGRAAIGALLGAGAGAGIGHSVVDRPRKAERKKIEEANKREVDRVSNNRRGDRKSEAMKRRDERVEAKKQESARRTMAEASKPKATDKGVRPGVGKIDTSSAGSAGRALPTSDISLNKDLAGPLTGPSFGPSVGKKTLAAAADARTKRVAEESSGLAKWNEEQDRKVIAAAEGHPLDFFSGNSTRTRVEDPEIREKMLKKQEENIARINAATARSRKILEGAPVVRRGEFEGGYTPPPSPPSGPARNQVLDPFGERARIIESVRRDLGL